MEGSHSQVNRRYLPHRPFPAYTYCRALQVVPWLPPARATHPVNHPQGHSYGDVIVTEDAWRWGIDLFNHGYFWEAHEAWEGQWRLYARQSSESRLLQGCIQASAAMLKIRERNLPGALALARRSLCNLRRVSPGTLEFSVEQHCLAWATYWQPLQVGTFPCLAGYPRIRLS